jgi:arylsulfatase A-like enzyme
LPRDDTLIVYTSDHGDFACEHGILEKAPGISSDAIGRVPMIWSWPGFTTPRTATWRGSSKTSCSRG